MRRGRKRKTTVIRSANGKSRGEAADKVRALVKSQPHRAWLPEALRLDQKAESPLGRLQLAGAVSEAEYEAGKRYASLVAKYRAVISSRDPCQRMGTSGGDGIDDEDARKVKRAYDQAFECMNRVAVQRVVAFVAVHERPCPPEQVALLREGLHALAVNFGLVRSGTVLTLRPKGDMAKLYRRNT